MIRTQIYLDNITHFRLKGIARIKKISMAELIRQYIISSIKKDFKPARLTNLAKLRITGGPKDLSEHMDDYLYGGRI